MHRLILLLSTVALCSAQLFAADGPAGGSAPASAPPAGSPPPGAPEGVGGGGGGGLTLLMMVGFIALMYFLLIRPQKKEQDKRKQMIKELKVGDRVVTIGGMHGTIVRKGEETVDLKVADGITLTFNLGAVNDNTAEPAKKD